MYWSVNYQRLNDLVSAQCFEVLSQFYVLQEHFYLETQATIAVPKGEDGEMELFVSTQNPAFTQVGNGVLFISLFIGILNSLFVSSLA